MHYSELTGNRLKASLGAKRVVKSYHNKHVSGSGNFGYVVRFATNDPTALYGEKWFNLSGMYDAMGQLTTLRFSPYISAGVEITRDNYDAMIAEIKVRLEGM